MSPGGRLLEWHLEALSVCHTFLGIRARGEWIRGIKSRPTQVPCLTLTNRPNKTPEYRSQNRIRAEKTCLYIVSDVLMSCMQWLTHLETVDHPKMGDNCGAKVQWQHSFAHALSLSCPNKVAWHCLKTLGNDKWHIYIYIGIYANGIYT